MEFAAQSDGMPPEEAVPSGGPMPFGLRAKFPLLLRPTKPTMKPGYMAYAARQQTAVSKIPKPEPKGRIRSEFMMKTVKVKGRGGSSQRQSWYVKGPGMPQQIARGR